MDHDLFTKRLRDINHPDFYILNPLFILGILYMLLNYTVFFIYIPPWIGKVFLIFMYSRITFPQGMRTVPYTVRSAR